MHISGCKFVASTNIKDTTMDYDQDYSRLAAADNKWYEDISYDKPSDTGDKEPDADARNNGNCPEKTCVMLDNEDFN